MGSRGPKGLDNRNKEILTKALTGKDIIQLAKEYNVSRQRILQIIKKQDKHLTRAEYGISKRKNDRITKRQEEIKKLYNRESYLDLTDLERAQGAFFSQKRRNNLHKKKHAWTLSMSDLDWPMYCPVLGIPLDWFATTRTDNSPSVDRLDSLKGYIPGNVAIMSWRANRIKNDGTKEEHFKIWKFLDEIK